LNHSKAKAFAKFAVVALSAIGVFATTAFVTQVVLTGGLSDRRATGEAEACEAEQNRPVRLPVRITIQRNSNGKYVTQFALKAPNEFESYWYLEYSDPPIVGYEDNRVFKIESHLRILETEESEEPLSRGGRRQWSHAYFEGPITSKRLSTPAVGQYPIRGQSRFSQVPGGPVLSHTVETGLLQAVDIAADVGSEVVAFDSGVVVYVQDDKNDEIACGEVLDGQFENYVAILQDNGFEAIYGHLRRGSVLVEEGQRVSARQELAKIGCFDGCDGGSHLHFHVGTITGDGLMTLPLRFYTDNPESAWAPQMGQTVAND
jgi:murein DD-endopeptidase MepM/ murein hydrolase activator NlpD